MMDIRDYFKEIEAESTRDAWLEVKNYLIEESNIFEKELSKKEDKESWPFS